MNQEEVFREAIRDNGRMIFGICCRFFGHNDQAKDVYQEILLKIWLNIKNFRGESRIRTWMTRIAVNVCLTNITKIRKSTSIFVPLTNLNYFDLSTEDYNDTEEEEAKLHFFEAFKSRLNPVDKTLVSLYLEDIEYREIAQITGLSEGNARTRVHRIKELIKQEWEVKNGIR
jgi:RNA polymerase sigma-70 factor, ECF subfamily